MRSRSEYLCLQKVVSGIDGCQSIKTLPWPRCLLLSVTVTSNRILPRHCSWLAGGGQVSVTTGRSEVVELHLIPTDFGVFITPTDHRYRYGEQPPSATTPNENLKPVSFTGNRPERGSVATLSAGQPPLAGRAAARTPDNAAETPGQHDVLML